MTSYTVVSSNAMHASYLTPAKKKANIPRHNHSFNQGMKNMFQSLILLSIDAVHVTILQLRIRVWIQCLNETGILDLRFYVTFEISPKSK